MGKVTAPEQGRVVSAISESGPSAAPSPRPRVSVALCTYNGSRWLPEFLESLLAQDLTPDELVVQDDASTDRTVSILEAFADRAPFPVRLVVNPVRVGSTTSFERALGRTRGRFVALADQDDIWYPRKLSRLASILDDDPILTLVFSDADLLDAAGRPTGGQLWSTRKTHRQLVTREIVPCVAFARRALSTGCTMMVRRRAVEAALPFPSALNDPVAPMRHDRWLSLVAAAVGTVRALPEALLGFRGHPDQQTGVLAPAERRQRLLATAIATLRAPDPVRAEEHEARARQVAEAAHRADLWGDFEEADQLRRVVAHHLTRADLGTTVHQRTRRVWAGVAEGDYDRTVLGAAAAAADLARAMHAAPQREDA